MRMPVMLVSLPAHSDAPSPASSQPHCTECLEYPVSTQNARHSICMWYGPAEAWQTRHEIGPQAQVTDEALFFCRQPASLILLCHQGVRLPHLLQLWVAAANHPAYGSSRSCICPFPSRLADM